MNILLDTSIIIEYTRTQQGVLKELFDEDFSDVRIFVSVLSFTEFWSGRSMKRPEVEKLAEVLFSRFEVLSVDVEIAKRAGKLRQTLPIETVDSIIASTALEKDCYLATLNVKHFQNVKELRFFEGR